MLNREGQSSRLMRWLAYRGFVERSACHVGAPLTNTITAIKNAQMAESPIVVMGVVTSTLLKVMTALDNRVCVFVFECV